MTSNDRTAQLNIVRAMLKTLWEFCDTMNVDLHTLANEARSQKTGQS